MCEFVSYHIMLWAWNIFGSFVLLNLEVVHNERLASLRKVELGATVATMNRLQRFDFRMLKLKCQKHWRKTSMTLVFQCFQHRLSVSIRYGVQNPFARSRTSTAKNSHGNPKHHEKLCLAEDPAGIVGLPHNPQAKKNTRVHKSSIINHQLHQPWTPLGPLAWTPDTDTRCEAGLRATMKQCY